MAQSAAAADQVDAPVATVPPRPLTDQTRERLLQLVADVPDFPEPGIVFKDISPLLADGPALSLAVDALAAPFAGVDLVVGIEARGFVLGAPVATRLGAGFVPARKPGKLPGQVVTASYDLEYGSAELQVRPDLLRPGARVLLVDDVLATGGTLAAAIDLVRRTGAQLVGAALLMELTFLAGRARIGDIEPHVLLSV